MNADASSHRVPQFTMHSLELHSMSSYLAIVALLVATGSIANAQRQPVVPLDRGLTLTWVSSLSGEPDYESRIEIVDSSAYTVTLRNSWNRGSRGGKVQWHVSERDLMHQIRLSSRSFYASIINENHDDYLTSTFFMAPVAVLEDLRAHGSANVEFFVPELSQMPYTGTLTRLGAEGFPVVFNDTRTSVRAIRAKAVLRSPSSSVAPELRMNFLILDNVATPWLVEVELVRGDGFRGHKQLARISYHANVEADLETRCRATVYDIHFATASAEIDPASSETLAAIAKAMADHRDWQLDIVGHTDSIGNSSANLDLSRRRAEATRLALVAAHHVDGARLRAEGRGEDQPIEDNGALAGRARNRRVELLRECRLGPSPFPKR
jgi:outer membrane protein OmpA-like peptidoglycan-associated protein